VLKKILTPVENVAVIGAVGVPVHYLAGLDWPWAILIGGAVLIALRWLLRSEAVARVRRRPLTGGG
jgi:hypothetical protein